MTDSMDALHFSSATTERAPALAALHAEVLAGQLTRLGVAVLQRFYERAIDQNLAQVMCALRDEKLIGFVVTAENESAALKRALRSSQDDYLWLLRHCNKLQLAGSALSQLTGSGHEEPDGTSLMYIGIAEQERGSGLAQGLLASAEANMQRQGVERYWLRVRCANPGAINFYFKSGFRAIDFEASTDQLVLTKSLAALVNPEGN